MAASSLEPLAWAALSVATKDAKDVLGRAPKGQGQPIDFLLRVRGTLDVNEDSSARVSTAPDLLALLMHAIERLPKRARAAAVADLAERYSADAPVCQATQDLVDDLKKMLTRAEVKPRRGAITGLIEIEPVQTQRSKA